MSIRIMSAVFESETLGPTERLILLSLADHADDEGRCYPSISRLCKRTGLKERTIQSNMRKLQDAGYVSVIAGAGRKGSNLYFVRATPAGDAPPQEMHPRTTCTTPPQEMHLPPAGDAPKPSITIIEPSEDITARKRVKVRIPENWHPGDEGIAYALDKNIPMEVIRDEIDGFKAYWLDRTDAQGRKSCEGWKQCWQNRIRAIAGRYAGRQSSRQVQRPASGQHPTDRAIAFAARARRTPGTDIF